MSKMGLFETKVHECQPLMTIAKTSSILSVAAVVDRSGTRNFEDEGGRGGVGVANLANCGIIYYYTSMIIPAKKRKIESTPLHSTFKLTKYRKNVKLTTFLMETSLKVQK